LPIPCGRGDASQPLRLQIRNLRGCESAHPTQSQSSLTIWQPCAYLEHHCCGQRTAAALRGRPVTHRNTERCCGTVAVTCSTPRARVADPKGLANAAAVMARAMSRWSDLRKMAWLVRRIARAVPYLGFIFVSGTKPRAR